MRSMRIAQIYRILFLTLFWVLCFVFIILFEGAVTDFKPIRDDSIPFHFLTLAPTILLAFIGASFTAAFEVLFFNKVFRKKPFGKTLLYKTSFYIFNMVFWFSIVILVTKSLEIGKPIYSRQVTESYTSFLFSYRFYLMIIYWCFVTFLGLFILQVSDKFGQGILLNFVLGKYHQPKIENRIFLFMDLKDSTPIAEKLGHVKYSQLLQDCYYELTEVVTNYNAQIYQYVGDEVVLTWKVGEGIKNNNCINIYFAYDYLITRNTEYYLRNYGIIPEFKAGLNVGEVTVAEVGEIKKELAYHGDVLNVASRIQDKCNDLKKRILISESLKMLLDQQKDISFELMGDIKLRGKEESISIYTIKISTVA